MHCRELQSSVKVIVNCLSITVSSEGFRIWGKKKDYLTLILFTVQDFYFWYLHGVPNFLLSMKFEPRLTSTRSNLPYVFLTKDVLKICSIFTGTIMPKRDLIWIKSLCFIKITLGHGCSPVNLLHIFRTPFSKNTSGGLLLKHYPVGIYLFKFNNENTRTMCEICSQS